MSKLRSYFSKAQIVESEELADLISMLKFDTAVDDNLQKDLQRWVEHFFVRLLDPSGDSRFPSDLSLTGPPMRSLRDVEEEVPIVGL